MNQFRLRVLVLQLGLLLFGCKKDDAQAHLERARAALFDRKFDVALAEYKLTIDQLESDQSGSAMLYRARALRGAADLYSFHLADPKRAVEVYRELIRLCPEAPETLEGRLHLAAVLWHDYRDLRGAIAEFSAALARNPPQSAEVAFTVAKLYFELQDYEQSELEAGKVTQKYETSPYVDDALFLRGQALAMMEGRKPEAQRVLGDLTTRFPDSPLVPHALVELGRLKAETEPEKAIELWIASLKTHPTPGAIQKQIESLRNRLRANTPTQVGNAVIAFDRDKQRPPPRRKTPKSSIEAVGGTEEEAQREATMSVERAEPRAQPSESTNPGSPPPAE